MVDIIDLMLATGARMGEILALRWIDFELDGDRPKGTISSTVKTKPSKGTDRKPIPKSDFSLRTVIIPGFAVAMLLRRLSATAMEPKAPVFPTRNGTSHQGTNIERRWRQVRKDTGLSWVTPHIT